MTTQLRGALKFFASCAKGLEYLLADELLALGCTRATAAMAGVNVEGTLADAQRAVLWSRLASRILWPLAEYDCADEHALYAGAAAVPWQQHLDASMTLAVDAHVSGDAITHARYAAQRVKDAVVDVLRAQTGARPNVDVEAPDLRLNLVVRKGRAILSVDLGGGPTAPARLAPGAGRGAVEGEPRCGRAAARRLAAAVCRRRRAARSDVRQRHVADRRRADGGRRRTRVAAAWRTAAFALAGLRCRAMDGVGAGGADARARRTRTPAPGVRGQRRRSARDPRRARERHRSRRARRHPFRSARRGACSRHANPRAAWSCAIRPTTHASPPIPRSTARSAMP